LNIRRSRADWRAAQGARCAGLEHRDVPVRQPTPVPRKLAATNTTDSLSEKKKAQAPRGAKAFVQSIRLGFQPDRRMRVRVTERVAQ